MSSHPRISEFSVIMADSTFVSQENHRDALYADKKCCRYKILHIYEPLLVTTLKHILTFAGIKCYFKLLHL